MLELAALLGRPCVYEYLEESEITDAMADVPYDTPATVGGLIPARRCPPVVFHDVTNLYPFTFISCNNSGQAPDSRAQWTLGVKFIGASEYSPCRPGRRGPR